MQHVLRVNDGNMKNKNSGFSLLEVLAASAIMAGLGGAIYKLQLISLGNSQQIITRQLMIQYSDNLINQMNEHLNYVGYSNQALYTLAMEPGAYAGESGKLENGYVEDNSAAEKKYTTYLEKFVDCTSKNCDDSQFASFLVNRWKKRLATQTNLPSENVQAIICRDDKMAIPTFDTPNCSNVGPMVLKVVWQPKAYDIESKGLGGRNDNYLVIRIATR